VKIGTFEITLEGLAMVAIAVFVALAYFNGWG
jgi:hypothetical protein